MGLTVVILSPSAVILNEVKDLNIEAQDKLREESRLPWRSFMEVILSGQSRSFAGAQRLS